MYMYLLLKMLAVNPLPEEPCTGGSVVSMSDSRPGGCEFDTQLR